MINSFPEEVVIVGGGRWSRVLIEVLCDIVPLDVKLTAFSASNSWGMRDWASRKGLEDRVEFISSLTAQRKKKLVAVIVANAAADHGDSAKWALENCYSVLVEKPICLSNKEMQEIVALAASKCVYLAAAHIFLFASYIDQFSKLVVEQKKILSIKVKWADSQSENRYGEVKTFDASLPIYADCLPHLIAILETLGIGSPKCAEVECFRGGAHAKIHLFYGDVSCVIDLERNSSARARSIEVDTQNKKIRLDFASEPGNIYIDSKIVPTDISWSENSKPLAKMLTSFMRGAADGIYDPRLDASIGVEVVKTLEMVAPFYSYALLGWIISHLDENELTIDMQYALTELLADKASHPPTSSNSNVKNLYALLKNDFIKMKKNDKKYSHERLKITVNKFKNSQ